MKKFLGILIALLIVFSNINEVKAYEVTDDIIMNLDGPGVIFEGELTQDENGNYKGYLKSNTGITAIKCVLYGNQAGVKNLYQIYIKWSGSNKVQSIQANNLYIKNSNVLDGTVYHSSGFFIKGLSSSSGYKCIDTCTIPLTETSVRIKTSGLQAYFYDRNFWVSSGEINGSFKLPN